MLKLFLLIALLKALTVTHKPSWCAGIYGGASLLLGVVLGAVGTTPFSHILISISIETALVFAYFWILEKLDGTFFWWLVALGGIGGLVFISFAGLLPLVNQH